MAAKTPKIGVWGTKTRALQETLSYEHVSLSWKTANVYRYLGSRTNSTPNINDIQNPVFLETPDRAYDTNTVEINVDFEPQPEQMTDLSQFGIYDPSSGEQKFKVHTRSYADLGRPIIEGDVLEIPFLEQDGHKAYFEVTDLDRKQEFENYYAIATARPMTADRQTEEIPTTNDNSDVFDSISSDLDTYVTNDVEHEGLETDGVETDEDQSDEDYDPRNSKQKSILDDPSATF